MVGKLRARLTYANVMSSIAVFLALGGVSYAVALPARSVGARQLRDGAVTTKKLRLQAVTNGRIARNAITSSRVRNRSLVAEDFRTGELPRGARGPTGPTGARGATGAAGASALNPVPSGSTIRGVVGASDVAATIGDDFGVDATLAVPAASGLTDADVAIVAAAGVTTDTNAGCTGTAAAPTAPAGIVCVYVAANTNADTVTGSSVLGASAGSQYGFKLAWNAPAAGPTSVDATWAYRAP